MFANIWPLSPKSYDSAAHLITLSKALPIEASKPSTALHSIAFLPSTLNEVNWLQPKLTTSTIGPLHIEIKRHESTKVSIRLRNCTADGGVVLSSASTAIYCVFYSEAIYPNAYFVGMYSLQWTLLYSTLVQCIPLLYSGAFYYCARSAHRWMSNTDCHIATVFCWTVLWIQRRV